MLFQTKRYYSLYCLCGACLTLAIFISGSVLGQEQALIGSQLGTRKTFLQMLDRPKVPLAPQVKALPELEGFTYEHFTFSSEQGQRVPAILLKKDTGGRRPVVVVLSGTGGTKEGQLPVLKTLAGLGFIAISMDGRYHGERQTGTGAARYVAAMLETYRTGQGYPFLYDTAWDLMRLMDYLETRPDVDAKRIGMTGFSKGGMETYLTAAIDPRIAVAVPMIGVQSFNWALEHELWMSRVGTFQAAVDEAAKEAGVDTIDAAFIRAFYDRVVPGIYTKFDGPAMVPLIAPRPLLVINGDSDARTPLPGLMACIRPTQQAYQRARASGKFKLYLQKDTGHTVKPEALQVAVGWFVKWLKP